MSCLKIIALDDIVSVLKAGKVVSLSFGIREKGCICFFIFPIFGLSFVETILSMRLIGSVHILHFKKNN